MSNKQQNITVKIGKKHLEMVKQMSEKLDLTQKACLEKTIEEAHRIMKQKSKLKAKLNIEEMSPDEAIVFLERKVESLGKNLDFIVGMIKLQEREILNPILTEAKTVSAQNTQIITALKKIK